MIYEVTLFTTYAGQKCVNRWNYLFSGTPAAVTGSFALINALGGVPALPLKTSFPDGSMFEAIRDLVHEGVSFDAVTAKAIYDVTDFYELPYIPAITGGSSGEGMGPVNAFGFKSSRSRTDIRRGTKRFVGVSEASVQGFGMITAGAAALLNTIAEEMTASQTYTDEGSPLTFAPIIVSKEKRPVPGKSTEAYYYYETEAEQMEHIAESIIWQPYPQVRSQTSRQYGRGQ